MGYILPAPSRKVGRPDRFLPGVPRNVATRTWRPFLNPSSTIDGPPGSRRNRRKSTSNVSDVLILNAGAIALSSATQAPPPGPKGTFRSVDNIGPSRSSPVRITSLQCARDDGAHFGRTANCGRQADRNWLGRKNCPCFCRRSSSAIKLSVTGLVPGTNSRLERIKEVAPRAQLLHSVAQGWNRRQRN